MFEKGTSGNPNGRPKKGRAWADVYDTVLDSTSITVTVNVNGEIQQHCIKGEVEEEDGAKKQVSMRYLLGVKLLEEGLSGNVNAIKELADRTEGRPRDKVEITEEENSKTFTVTFND